MVKIFSSEGEELLAQIDVCKCCVPRMLSSVLPDTEDFMNCMMDLRIEDGVIEEALTDRLNEALSISNTVVLDRQSGVEAFSIATGAKETVQQTVGFTDQNPAYNYLVDSMPDPSFSVADTGGQSLEDFMCRPLRIAEYDWSTTDPAFLQSFNPWALFFDDPRVVNRVSNFNLLRCKMHVKFQINGNGFHYGRLLVSYKPLPNQDDFTKNRAFFIEDAIAASQQPHLYLDPTTSQGGDMVLPFFWYYNALSIPQSEWSEMGEITIRSLNNLKHANGATDSVTISVWAWAEDVSLSIPTSENPVTISPQSGVEVLDAQAGDEYGTGPISRPASILARAAGALIHAPVIGMYARATEMAASAVSSIATSFGYSRPAIISDIAYYRPTMVGNLANTNMPDSVVKLSVDAKQETTIDPRVTGMAAADEMAIKEIAKRESFLCRFPWEVASTPTTLLWSARVSPMLWSEISLANNTEIHLPACAFAALPFDNWRGSMKFRFQIVSSNFHKGRLRIVYDPRTAANDSFNTVFTQIVDIAEEKDVTMCVGWGVQLPYAEMDSPGTDAIPWLLGSFGTINPTPYQNHNGIIFVEVLNSLTVPNSTVDNDIEVNVFVSACDDFEVANPNSKTIDNYVWFETPAVPALQNQAGTESAGLTTADKEDTDEPSKPVASEALRTLGAEMSPTARLADICYGEKITSFRQMAKRYNLHTTFGNTSIPPSQQVAMYSRRTGDFPFYRGHVGASAVHSEPVLGGPYNYCRMTLLNYITPAFVGRRGGIRYKTQQIKQLAIGNVNQSMASVERQPNPRDYTESSVQIFLDNETNGEAALQCRQFHLGHSGMNVQAVLQNPVLEYELPYYQNRRFYPAKQKDQTTNASANQFHEYKTMTAITPDQKPFFFDYVAGAEDFALIFFTGCPVLYYAPTDPT